jgi:hypothetical protein
MEGKGCGGGKKGIQKGGSRGCLLKNECQMHPNSLKILSILENQMLIIFRGGVATKIDAHRKNGSPKFRMLQNSFNNFFLAGY